MQELFFLVIGVFVELFTVMIWFSLFGLAYCTLRNGTLRNETKRNEICTLRNENLYFAK